MGNITFDTNNKKYSDYEIDYDSSPEFQTFINYRLISANDRESLIPAEELHRIAWQMIGVKEFEYEKISLPTVLYDK